MDVRSVRFVDVACDVQAGPQLGEAEPRAERFASDMFASDGGPVKYPACRTVR